jgi:hypothetical protein
MMALKNMVVMQDNGQKHRTTHMGDEGPGTIVPA